MSLAVLRSRALAGMEALCVSVEVHLANGLPGLTMVSLPDAEVRESKDRGARSTTRHGSSRQKGLAHGSAVRA